ncbi:MAG: tail fiber domain-containing protein [Flavobacteriales bacterium]|nr:tail fiber domain-containing protein [Flavobacteriales bacterium]
MRTKVLLGAMLLSVCMRGQAPDWNTNGNSSTSATGNFLGTDDPTRLTIRTDDLYRIQVNETETNTIGSFTLMPCDGFVGISPSSDFWSGTYKTPFSRLHLAEGSGDNEQALGYRPWQRNGISLTGNADQGYLGQKFSFEDPTDHESGELEDYTDIVIQWSDNPGKWLKDRLRFIFTSAYDESATGAGSLEGLEGMRLFPADDDNVNVGIGDWYAANVNSSGAITEPEERLDIVDGKVRIRQLPDDAPTEDEKVMVVDDDGVVHWRPMEDFAGQTDCDWTVENAGTSGSGTSHDVYTAVGSDNLCPDADDFVGIGTSSPTAKLHVATSTAGFAGTFELSGSSTGKRAGLFTTTGTGTVHYGVQSSANGALSSNYYEGNQGVYGAATADGGDATESNRGVHGLASVLADNTVTHNVAVDAETSTQSGSAITYNFGVRSIAYSYATGTSNYAGYFDAYAPNTTNNWSVYTTGAAYTPSGVWNPSDGSLKTNIVAADVEAAAQVLDAITLHGYDFNQDACPQMDLPNGPQLGVLADEFAAVMPNLVRDAVQPPTFDADGNQVHPAVSFKAVNYGALVPYLVAGYQAQQALIAEQGARLDALAEALANCCASGMQLQGNGPAHGTAMSVDDATISGDARHFPSSPTPSASRPRCCTHWSALAVCS